MEEEDRERTERSPSSHDEDGLVGLGHLQGHLLHAAEGLEKHSEKRKKVSEREKASERKELAWNAIIIEEGKEQPSSNDIKSGIFITISHMVRQYMAHEPKQPYRSRTISAEEERDGRR